MPPGRVFGPNTSDATADAFVQSQGSDPQSARRPSARVSFSGLTRKPSILSRWSRAGEDEESGLMQPPERPAIPSALQAPGEAYATPLPVLSMIVLSIVCAYLLRLGER